MAQLIGFEDTRSNDQLLFLLLFRYLYLHSPLVGKKPHKHGKLLWTCWNEIKLKYDLFLYVHVTLLTICVTMAELIVETP